MRVKLSRRSPLMALLPAVLLLCAGCSGKGTGDTVPSPPRDLVDKSFHPPAGAAQTGGAAPKSGDSAPTPAGK